jgi:hypothetical protein
MKLHRGSEEGGVAKDIEDILTGWHEDGFTLMNLYAIDIGFSPKTYHDDKGVAVEVNLLGNLYHYAMYHEIWTVDEL